MDADFFDKAKHSVCHELCEVRDRPSHDLWLKHYNAPLVDPVLNPRDQPEIVLHVVTHRVEDV